MISERGLAGLGLPQWRELGSLIAVKKRTGLGPHPDPQRGAKWRDFKGLCQEIWIHTRRKHIARDDARTGKGHTVARDVEE